MADHGPDGINLLLSAGEAALARPTCGPACDNEAPEAVLAELDATMTERERTAHATPHVCPGMSREDYDKAPGINISLLVHGLRTMAHLDWERRYPSEPTDEMVLGSALHEMLLEPGTANQRVGCRENGAAAKKAAEGTFPYVLRKKQYEQACGMRDAVKRCAAARELLECPGKGEMSFFWRDEDTGLWCKGRVDRFCEWRGYSVVLDLKTTTDASPADFKWQVARMHYHVKAAWYLDGLRAIQEAERRFFWLAVEKDAPYLCALYEPPDEPGALVRPDISLSRGRAIYRNLLERFASCEKSGKWPGYSEGVEPLGSEGGE